MTESQEESLFEQAMARYQDGAAASDVLDDFIAITNAAPRQSAGWTCLAWLGHARIGQARQAWPLDQLILRYFLQRPFSIVDIWVCLFCFLVKNGFHAEVLTCRPERLAASEARQPALARVEHDQTPYVTQTKNCT